MNTYDNYKRCSAESMLKKCNKLHDCAECVNKYREYTPCKIFGHKFKESMWDYREKVQK